MVEVLRMRLRAGGDALVGRRAGLALNQLDALHRHAELFGDELRLRGVESLPHLAFAGERRDRAIGRDRQASRPALSAGCRRASPPPARTRSGREREGHDKRAAGLQHRAA